MLREVSNGVSTLVSSSPISFVFSFLSGAYVWVYVRLQDLLLVQHELIKGDEWSRWGVTLCFVIISTDQFNIDPKDCWWSIMLVEGFHISNIILLTCRTWLIDHLSPTFESWFARLILMIMFWSALEGHVHHDHHKRNLQALLKFIRAKNFAFLKSCIQPDGHLRYRPNFHSATTVKYMFRSSYFCIGFKCLLLKWLGQKVLSSCVSVYLRATFCNWYACRIHHIEPGISAWSEFRVKEILMTQ